MVVMNRRSRIGFVGAGMVGKSMAVALSRQGYSVQAAASRTFHSAQALAGLVPGCVAYPTADGAAEASDVVFATVPDDAIGLIAAGINWRQGQAVVHCSGAASLDVLAPAARRGTIPGAFHPLQTFSSVAKAVESLPGCTFAIEGNAEMQAFLKEMALALGGNPVVLRAQDKALYHASLVTLGDVLTGLAGAAADLWQHFGIDRNQALKSLAPLIHGYASALSTIGLPGAATGPYVRGDIGTVRKHLDALRAIAPGMLPFYCQMALAALPIALEKGSVPKERATEIREMLATASVHPVRDGTCALGR